jgi:hypothetical protein
MSELGRGIRAYITMDLEQPEVRCLCRFINTACNSFIWFQLLRPDQLLCSKRFDNVFDVSTPPIQRLPALG